MNSIRWQKEVKQNFLLRISEKKKIYIILEEKEVTIHVTRILEVASRKLKPKC